MCEAGLVMQLLPGLSRGSAAMSRDDVILSGQQASASGLLLLFASGPDCVMAGVQACYVEQEAPLVAQEAPGCR